MQRHLVTASVVSLAVTIGALLLLFFRAGSAVSGSIDVPLDEFEKSFVAGLAPVNASSAAIASDIERQRNAIQALTSLQIPSIPLNPFTAPVVEVVRQFDARRRERLREVEAAINRVSTQLGELNAQTTSLDQQMRSDMRELRETLRESNKPSGLFESAIALAGSFCSLCTLFFVYREDRRRTKELELKVAELTARASSIGAIIQPQDQHAQGGSSVAQTNA